MKNTVYLYVFDTMADWEIGYLSLKSIREGTTKRD
jgi:hypothetical protein